MTLAAGSELGPYPASQGVMDSLADDTAKHRLKGRD
jgi:hypothetical protein